MQRYLVSLVCLLCIGLPQESAAGNEVNFLVRTTRELVNLCTMPEKDPLHDEAVHFCQGYLVGAYHYYLAQNQGPEGQRLVCLPDPPPTRDEAINRFLGWAKAHPQYMDEMPVETQFRFLTETWPCK